MQAISYDRDPLLQPYQWMSLWEMIQINLGMITALITYISQSQAVLFLQSRENPTARVIDIKDSSFNITVLKTLLEKADGVAKELKLQGSGKFLEILIHDLDHINVINLEDNLSKLQRMLESELREESVMYIPRNNAWWFNNKLSFGDTIIKAFPSALEDVEEAGNCYALDRPTACVFHAMRILEYGLVALAKDVNVTFDMQQWHIIIEKIESEIKTLRKLPQGSQKTERLQFLSEAAKEFMYFKDGWRNHVSHRRVIYDMSQASSVLFHVRTFMQHLSKELKE